jgi:carboxymethylenebutenolidase
MLPATQPTGKKVEVGFVVIVGIKDGKITHEHIYWDQACVLVQTGLLDPTGLPVCGAESARRISDPSRPTRNSDDCI